MDAPETFQVEETVVSCDGGDGPLGHPRVWLNMGRAGFVDCPYCDRRYVLKSAAPTAEEAAR